MIAGAEKGGEIGCCAWQRMWGLGGGDVGFADLPMLTSIVDSGVLISRRQGSLVASWGIVVFCWPGLAFFFAHFSHCVLRCVNFNHTKVPGQEIGLQTKVNFSFPVNCVA